MTEQAQLAAKLELLFSTSSVHARDRLSFWHEEATKAFVTHEFSTNVGRSFEGQIHVGTIGPVGVAHFTCDSAQVRRTPRCLKFAHDDDLLFTLQLNGETLVHQDGRDAITSAGGVYLLDPRRPFSLDIRSQTKALLLKIPRLEMQARLGDLSELTARLIPGHRPELELASRFLIMLVQQVRELDDLTSAKVAQQLLDLIALAYEAHMPDRRVALSSTRAATLLRLKAVIEARLHESHFKPSIAAAGAGISVRYANALLSEENTSLERYILYRRLQRCRQALEDPIQLYRPISDIAYDNGFSDMSHFTRRFRAEFGNSPREHRANTLMQR